MLTRMVGQNIEHPSAGQGIDWVYAVNDAGKSEKRQKWRKGGEAVRGRAMHNQKQHDAANNIVLI